MLKDDGPPKEPLRVKAERKWRNNAVRKRIAEEKRKPQAKDPDETPEVARVISNDGRRDGSVMRMERKFLKDIRAMMEGRAAKNLAAYAASIEYRRRKLLAEKLRRLQLAQQGQRQ